MATGLPDDADSLRHRLRGLHAGRHAVHEGDPIEEKVLHEAPEFRLAAQELFPARGRYPRRVIGVAVPQHARLRHRPRPGLVAVLRQPAQTVGRNVTVWPCGDADGGEVPLGNFTQTNNIYLFICLFA